MYVKNTFYCKIADFYNIGVLKSAEDETLLK